MQQTGFGEKTQMNCRGRVVALSVFDCNDAESMYFQEQTETQDKGDLLTHATQTIVFRSTWSVLRFLMTYPEADIQQIH